jgi:hypothetical protein
VGAPLRHARHHRQDRLLAVERLDLGLLVYAENECAVGRRQIEADDVTGLVDEQRIARQLEGLRAVRPQPERRPDAPDRGVEKPVALAIERIDQCVASAGVERSVRSITAAT